MTTTPAGFEHGWRLASAIDGWLTREQAEALARAAAEVGTEAAIVEIGSHHGRSTTVLARAKAPSVRLLAVDPFDDPRWGGGAGAYEAFRRNLERAGVEGSVEAFRGLSTEAVETWDGSPVGLLYVDGAHDRSSVLLDLDRWGSFITPGGLLYVHDAYSSPGVTFALLQRCLLGRSYRYLGSVRSLAVFRREDLSPAAAAGNAVRMLTRLPYFARNVLVKVAMRRGWELPQRLLGHREAGYPY